MPQIPGSASFWAAQGQQGPLQWSQAEAQAPELGSLGVWWEAAGCCVLEVAAGPITHGAFASPPPAPRGVPAARWGTEQVVCEGYFGEKRFPLLGFKFL